MQYLCPVTKVGAQMHWLLFYPEILTGIVNCGERDKRTVRLGPCALPGE